MDAKFTLIPFNVAIDVEVDFQYDLYSGDAIEVSLEAKSGWNSTSEGLVEADVEIGSRFIMDL
jgi:hypothetical protein